MMERSARSFGAVGDGLDDDRLALEAASAWLNAEPGRTLTVVGTPRVGRRATPVFTDSIAKDGAITILQPEHATLVFAPGARLLMDNLGEADVGDDMHGIVVRGPGHDVLIVAPRVEWVTEPGSRSQGDGIRCHGYPHDSNLGAAGDGLISRITVLDSYVKWAPQSGLVFNGCSDVRVSFHQADETLADGCHFNACRRVEAGNISGKATGDDTCAFVTYYDAASVETGTPGIAPYAQPSLTEWCGSESHVGTVNCQGSEASALRLAGALDVHVDSVVGQGATQAASADGGVSGGDFDWSFLQPRGCSIGLITATACGIGYQSRSFNTDPETDDENFWRQDVAVGSVVARGCTNKSVHIDTVAGTSIGSIDAEDCPVIGDHVEDVRIGSIRLFDAGLTVIQGRTDDETFGNPRPPTNLFIGSLSLTGSSLNLQDVSGGSIGVFRSVDAPRDGLVLERTSDLALPNIAMERPNRDNDEGEKRGILAFPALRIRIGQWTVTNDTNNFMVFNVQSGSVDISIEDLTVETERNADDLPRYVDAATDDIYFSARFRNNGEASPVWRYAHAAETRT